MGQKGNAHYNTQKIKARAFFVIQAWLQKFFLVVASWAVAGRIFFHQFRLKQTWKIARPLEI